MSYETIMQPVRSISPGIHQDERSVWLFFVPLVLAGTALIFTASDDSSVEAALKLIAAVALLLTISLAANQRLSHKKQDLIAR